MKIIYTYDYGATTVDAKHQRHYKLNVDYTAARVTTSDHAGKKEGELSAGKNLDRADWRCPL